MNDKPVKFANYRLARSMQDTHVKIFPPDCSVTRCKKSKLGHRVNNMDGSDTVRTEEIKKREGVSGRTLRPPRTRCKMAEPQALIRSLDKRDIFDSIRAVLCRTIEKMVYSRCIKIN